MLVPVRWLKDYVEIEGIDVKTLEERLIMTGSNIETVQKVCSGIQNIVVGEILTMEKHPDADKLWVMQVNVGAETVQIVTGAQNCFVGAHIPVALHGSCISGGDKIKKGKLRGVESNGMLCSLEELGFTGNVIPKKMSEGIFILDDSYAPGMDILEAIPEMDDDVIEFEITPNRPDCLSMKGMAREAAVTFEKSLINSDITLTNAVEDVHTYAKVSIEAKDLCKRYGAMVVKNVAIKPSPVWMQIRLMKAGMRPISNIVDITNYVMLEYGQPIHAFDLETLHDHEIIVRRAKEGELLTTLDGVERTLTSEMLVIADPKKAVAIAGVMGGEETEIKDDTKNILIEVAVFDKTNIRKTSKDIGLRSEASSRFEKGVPVCHVETVLNRVCQLIEMLEAGQVVAGQIDVYPEPLAPKVIDVRVSRMNGILGTHLTATEMMAIFKPLGIEAVLKSEEIIECIAPLFRLDLEKEIDFSEEIARIYGYENIELTMPSGASYGKFTFKQCLENESKDWLTAQGYNEVVTYSFVSPSQVDKLMVPEDHLMRQQCKLLNPLGEEFSMMRTTLMGNMLEVLSRNYNRRIESAKAFELGNLFEPVNVPITELPIEKLSLVIGAYGGAYDFFELKGSVEALFEKIGISNYQFVPNKNHTTFHPGRCASIIMDEKEIGVIGEIHPKVQENYDLGARTYLAEIHFEELNTVADLVKKYQPLPKFPAMTRDLAMLVKSEVTNGEMIETIKSNGKNLLESVALFDVYTGKQIEDGYKSMAYALVFRAADRTLTDEEVTKVFNKMVEELEKRFDAKMR